MAKSPSGSTIQLMVQVDDIIALRMKRPDSLPDHMHQPANRIDEIPIPVEPGCTVFIIGFPSSPSVGFGLPLWKSGYIASEPHYDITVGGKQSEFGGLEGGNVLPAFFVDSQTRKGMSGSPLFAQYVGNWDSADPYGSWNPNDPEFFNRSDIFLGTKAMEFVGCYSGRLKPREEAAALSLCWRETVIEEICRAKKIANHPHVTSLQICGHSTKSHP